MLFGEMTDWVLRTTKRPDKRQDVKDAINRAISFFTLGASFSQDMIEGTVAINATQYAQSISVTTYFPRLRRFKYLKIPGQRGYINYIDPNKVFDRNGCEALNRWYRSGDNIVFKLNMLSATLDYGYYMYPALLVATGDSHWMLDVTPTMIHDRVASEIFQGIGEPSEAKRYLDLAMGHYLVAKDDFETGATAVAA